MRTSKEIAKTLGLDSADGTVFVEPHSAASEQLVLQQNAIVIELLLDIRDLLQPHALTEDDVRRIVMETITKVAHEAVYGS